jgi:hypothetical protein
MEEIGRLGLTEDTRRLRTAKHILAILMDGAVRGMACRSFVANARYCANI